MRKIIACEFMTLDGVIQNEDEGDGFKWGGWFFLFVVEVTGAVMQERLGKAVDLLLGGPLTVGRRTGRRIRTSGQIA